jgi:hypothetical protein
VTGLKGGEALKWKKNVSFLSRSMIGVISDDVHDALVIALKTVSFEE